MSSAPSQSPSPSDSYSDSERANLCERGDVGEQGDSGSGTSSDPGEGCVALSGGDSEDWEVECPENSERPVGGGSSVFGSTNVVLRGLSEYCESERIESA